MKFYVSSTTDDLGEFRSKVAEVIQRAGHQALHMGLYGAETVPPLDKCLEDVSACDVYVGIFAWHYGQVATGREASITELEYRRAKSSQRKVLIFVLHEDAAWPVKQIDKGATGDRMNALRSELLRQEAHTASLFVDREDLLVRVSQSIRVIVSPPELRVSIARLPSNRDEIVGREDELQLLDDAWLQQRLNVLCLIGFGGTGKSALVWQWLTKMADDNYRGAAAVFGWSFFSREQDQREVSADLFITKAFEWFKEQNVPTDPIEKGTKLAEVVRRRRTLLVLDGLEAVQRADGLNLSLLAMLKDLALAGENRGLCIVTSRSHVSELARSSGLVRQVDLGQLSPQAGAVWLRRLGVNGSQAELEAAAREYRGHALSLTLLGTFLANSTGSIADRPTGGARFGDEEEVAFGRLMTTYEELLDESPELDLLRVLGLFNRPAPRAALDAVRATAPIPGLTDQLYGLDERRWKGAVTKLRQLRLVMDPPRDEKESVEFIDGDTLDTHALVRHHFAKQVQDRAPDAWKEANNRLFEHYRSQTQDLPLTFAEMEPLFQAVAHGCQAGRHQAAWNDDYWKRIRQGDRQYSVLTLGAYAADLVALTHFFVRCWDRPVDTLDDLSKARVWTETAFDLRGVGRVSDAFVPMRAGLASLRAQERWWAACDAAGNLSELLTLWGDLRGAKAAAEDSIQLAKQAQEVATTPHDAEEALRTLSTNIATLAEVLHQVGDLPEAERQFRLAEEKFLEAEKEYGNPSRSIPCLHALRGYHYCDLLLSMGRYDEVREKAQAIVLADTQADLPYGVGLARMAHARVLIANAKAGTRDFAEARAMMNTANAELRNAGHHELISRSLLVSAELQQAMGDFDLAVKQLNDAIEDRTRGQMRLLEADALLQLADVYLAAGKPTEAREKFSRARRMVKDFGYGRRQTQVEVLAAKLAQ